MREGAPSVPPLRRTTTSLGAAARKRGKRRRGARTATSARWACVRAGAAVRLIVALGRVAPERIFRFDHFAEPDAARRARGAAGVAWGLRLVRGAVGRKPPAHAPGRRGIAAHGDGTIAVRVQALRTRIA